jgi:hypothetical protein
MPDNQDVVLKIRIFDSQGNFLRGTVDTEIRHCGLNECATERAVDASHEIEICGLRRDYGGEYEITVTPNNGLQPHSQFVKIPRSGYATADFVLKDSVATAPPSAPTADPVYAVEGTVTSPDRPGVGRLRVQIVDKNVGQDLPLTEATTNERGRYTVRFAIPSLSERRKEQPDLQARVYAERSFLAASDVHYNATTNETLNVQLPPNSALLASEHETLQDAIAARYSGQLRDLKESEEQHDITYLANKTGWDARAVALAALADLFSASTADGAAAISPALYYALFRAGLPANPETLYHTDAATVSRIWKQSIEQGVIPKALESELPTAAQKFQSLSAARALDVRAMAGTSTLKEMLQLTLGDDARRQQQFADLFTANRGDMPNFWEAVQQAFGADTTKRLQLDGQLGYLTLNNAPLIGRLHAESREPLSSALDLVPRGYYRGENWSRQITGTIIPDQIPGTTLDEKRTNYAELMAAQVRLSFPTAVVADMVRTGDFVVEVPDQVHAFLTEHQGEFEIGAQPVQQYIVQNRLQVVDETVNQVKRLQRVYQITPDDQAMAGLLKHGLDAAYHIVRYQKDEFVQHYAPDLGGAETAQQVYDKSVQVHNIVLNIVVSYLTAKNGIQLGAVPLAAAEEGSASGGQILQPAPKTRPSTREEHMFLAETGAANAADVIAYPTLEGLFGPMDFCTCEHCRSVLSPAAYLVDLLHFIDHKPTPEQSNNKLQNPQEVLFLRRPDIQHLPLTCENTNTALPYIDVVNETLEYFIAHGSLRDYAGHDTGNIATEDLLASPQYVEDAAYNKLASELFFPTPLPFHRPLESLRCYFDKFGVPLRLAMERLCKKDDLNGWHNMLLEELRLSRPEYQLLTNDPQLTNDPHDTLCKMYGFPDGTAENAAIGELSNAKNFTRRVGITYDDLFALLQTRFVNPNADLLPKLERLGVPFATLAELKNNNNDDSFDNLLKNEKNPPDPSEYDNDIKKWVKNDHNFVAISRIITLTDPKALIDPKAATGCNFDNVEFRHTMPSTDPTRLDSVEFIRLLRFIRLWKKTGWTIEQTDAAICALLSIASFPLSEAAIDTVDKLDKGFQVLLPRLGNLSRVMRALQLSPERDLLPLLACWSDLGTHGANALYRQMFLNPTVLQKDAAFADNGYGEFLDGNPAKKNNPDHLVDHAEALRSAFNLTGDEFDLIFAAFKWGPSTPLTMDNISKVYRWGWLARKLRLSIRELLLLTSLTGLDPFTAPDSPSAADPAMLRLIAFVQELQARSMKSAEALYLIWNQDLSGKSAPDPVQLTELARALRTDFAAIEDQFAAVEDPSGNIARSRMALVYGQEATDAFFGLLDDTLTLDAPCDTPPVAAIAAIDSSIVYDNIQHKLSYVGVMTPATRDALKAAAGQVLTAPAASKFQAEVDVLFTRSQDDTQIPIVDYTHGQPALEPLIAAAASRIAYDSFRHRLFHSGLLNAATRIALEQAAATMPNLKTAIEILFARSQDALDSFFGRYPELRPLYKSWVASTDPPDRKRTALLEAFDPALVRLRKRQQALQRLSTASGVDLEFTRTLLDPAIIPNGRYPLHAAGDTQRPALDDALALQTPGLTVQFFSNDTATGAADGPATLVANLDYAKGGANSLPSNSKQKDAVISGIWNGSLEIPETGFYNIVVDADPGATVTLLLDGDQLTPPPSEGGVWRNSKALELKAGTLYTITIKAEKVRDRFSVKWETPKRARELIPARYLYPPTVLGPFSGTYTRFLKVAALDAGLHLTANEIVHFGTHEDYQIPKVNGDGWLNMLPASGDSASPNSLLQPFEAVLNFARIKAALSPNDERLLIALRDPKEATAKPDSGLYALARWDPTSLDDLLGQFGHGGDRTALSHFDLFQRVHDAFALIKTMGIAAAALIRATTNDPDGNTVRDLQAALCARYTPGDWREVLRPINDQMRSLQRNALVAYILHKMRGNKDTERIDTADKLFEYFLMDVEMEPCMQTSRIRHALSSVQLFIERCLMNLETAVLPTFIKAEQWAWMKRYRVWQANREVFLWPENWLDPELRDDKSPFFKEIESELLQSDITEDSATTALLNYLAKLEEVAKLEPCGIYHQEGDTQTGDVDHVIARTAGAHRKYYYRRYESGSWTPWEQIKLDIEDNPVMLVVWQGRLLLFWLRIMKKGPDRLPTDRLPKAKSVKETELGHLKTKDLPDDPKVTVQAILCWSEYYNGKWQPTKTSDVNRPVQLGDFDSAFFARSGVLLSASEELDALRISVADLSSFLLYNTHSVPIPQDHTPNSPAPSPERTRYLSTYPYPEYKLSILYTWGGKVMSDPSGNVLGGITNDILIDHIPDTTTEIRHTLRNASNSWTTPFFFEDSRHVFFVTTTEGPPTVQDSNGFRAFFPPSQPFPDIPHLVLRHDSELQIGGDRAGPIGDGRGFGFVDPSPMQRFVTEDAYIQTGIGSSGSVRYDGLAIGPAGALPNQQLQQS